MRIDKYLSNSAVCSRSECAKAVKQGQITVNGVVVKKTNTEVKEIDTVTYYGTVVSYHPYFYIMLNKPIGVVSATEATGETTVLDLLPENLQKKNLFPCGRLDKNTTGLVIMTNDGVLAHQLLAPKNHVSKDYSFHVKFPLSQDDITFLEKGIDIGEGIITKPCIISDLSDDKKQGIITLTEGKYHQIKRMMQAVHNQITRLKRISFGGISLDESLAEKEWRELTQEEETILKSNLKTKGE